MSARLWAVAVLVATAAFVASPWLVPGFGGFEPGQFPVPQDDPPVQPAGYAFAIWGLIYAWLAVSAVFGLAARADAPDWAAFRPQLALSLALGAGWLAVARMSPLGATVLIWAMWLPAVLALFAAPALDRWWARVPVALYAGWLTAAASVSVGLVLAGYGLTGEVAAALFALVLALVLAVSVQVRLHSTPEYGAAVIWALAAVIVANLGGGNALVIALAGLGIAALAFAMLRAATDD